MDPCQPLASARIDPPRTGAAEDAFYADHSLEGLHRLRRGLRRVVGAWAAVARPFALQGAGLRLKPKETPQP